MYKNIEILAPAGNTESLISAINNGANAVYLGLSNFNARAKAQNFTADNIREYTKLAHLYNVKVNVTINTLINDTEVKEFLSLVKSAVEAKVDAFIIQDIGMASILKKAFPNIVMHASTQMGIHNLEGTLIAQELGFSRIVLSRETKLEDIKLIKENTNLELEYFVQGALCVAFSGNCYFSSICHNQSGNRGKCLQPCRLPYSYDGKNFNYLISPADLCLLKSLSELISAGVSSFKIEGRLRRPAYVAQAVQTYRKTIDALQEKTQIDYDKEIKNLSKVFNRGEYNFRAYLDGGTPNYVINKQCNNHIGVPIGKVLKVERFKEINKITINSTHTLSNNDGLKFFVDNNEVASIGVGNFERLDKDIFVIYSKHRPPVNANINLILDYSREQYLVSIKKKLKINANILANENHKLTASVIFNDLSITCESEYVCPKAINNPTTAEEIIAQFNKLNDTKFELENINVETKNVFIPKSILNDLRRNAIRQIEQEIVSNYEKTICVSCDNEFISNLSIKEAKQSLRKDIVIINNVKELLNIKNKEIIVCYSPNLWSNEIKETLQNIKNLGYMDVALNLPIIANSKDVTLINSILKSLDFKPYLISNNIWGLQYLKQGYQVICGYNHNIFNSISANFLLSLGVSGIVQSIEKESSYLDDCYGYVGKPSLMNFCHCPYKTYKNSTCVNCGFSENLILQSQQNQSYQIRRIKLSLCYFELVSNIISMPKNKLKCYDLRNLKTYEIKNIFK